MIIRKIVLAVSSALVLSLATEIIKMLERKLSSRDDERTKEKLA